MGWTFGYKSKAEAVREVRGWSGVIDVLDPSTEDERTWEAWGLARYLSEDSDGVILFVVLLEYDPRSRTWGTKVIDELCGPYYYNVPLAFASRATVRNPDWRETYLLRVERHMLPIPRATSDEGGDE